MARASKTIQHFLFACVILLINPTAYPFCVLTTHDTCFPACPTLFTCTHLPGAVKLGFCDRRDRPQPQSYL